jgi:hypothetical protein
MDHENQPLLWVPAMPAKKTKLTEAERAKRIREAAEKHGTSNEPKDLERALKKVTARPTR